MQDTAQQAATEHAALAAAAKSMPPVAVSGATIAGVPMADIVLWLTAFYLVIQIVYLAWKWQKEYRANEIEDRRNEDTGHNPERRKRK